MFMYIYQDVFILHYDPVVPAHDRIVLIAKALLETTKTNFRFSEGVLVSGSVYKGDAL